LKLSKDYFNAGAAAWDQRAAEKDIQKLEAMAARLVIEPGCSVLDVGTGTGVFIPFILQKIGRQGTLVCLDYSEEMLKIARAKGFKGQISFICADIENSRITDNSFNVIVCYSVFPHFSNKPKALQEIYRLLKNNGRLYICHTSSRQSINKIHRDIPAICDHLFPENQEMRRLLKDAGFKDISIRDGTGDYLASAYKRG
jgi:ubiquinone/menaquinone biosynthesis C-methylase UbiE